MTSLIAGLGVVLIVARYAFFAAAAVVAVVCAVDWAVRTRRISPFNPVARFFRRSIDPLMAPVERRIVRAGGNPSSAPWWTLAAIVVIGLVVISLLGFVIGQIAMLAHATQPGGPGLLRVFLSWTFAILRIAIIVTVISSWVRVSPYSPWVRWAFVISEPILRPLRRIVPTIGMIDITPIVAYLLLSLLEGLVLGAL